MQEEEYFGGVGVAFREGEEVEVVVTDVEILLADYGPYEHTSQVKRGEKYKGLGEEVRLCPRLRNMVERLSFLLRLRRGGWETFRRRTWVCRLCSCGLGESKRSTSKILVCSLLRYSCGWGAHFAL